MRLDGETEAEQDEEVLELRGGAVWLEMEGSHLGVVCTLTGGVRDPRYHTGCQRGRAKS